MESIRDIYKKFLNNQCTTEEREILFKYFDTEDDNLIGRLIDEELYDTTDDTLPSEMQTILQRNRAALNSLVQSDAKKQKRKKWIAAASIAASLLLICSLAYFPFKSKELPVNTSAFSNNEIFPGTNRATLVLDNGASYNLRQDGKGIMASGNTISYTDGTKIISDKKPFNATLIIPRKGQYFTVLPDGTKVWLNAESSLKYPTAFTAAQRVVELEGEGYFEVSHDKAHPFIVKTKNQTLQVLGTEFNIKAYPNENLTQTTLLTGSIQVRSNTSLTTNILKPQQQASLAGSAYSITTVDVEAYSAWKDGEFRFKSTPLPEVIRQLERWYDFDVNYSELPKNIKINISISKDKKLSSVLNVLSDISSIKFKIEGRRLMADQ